MRYNTTLWVVLILGSASMFQLSDVDYVGKTDKDLSVYSSFYRDAFLACMDSDEQAWQNKTLTRGQEVIPVPAGKDRLFDIIKVPLFNEDGSRKGLVVLGRDISDLLETERRLRKEVTARKEANIALKVLLEQQQVTNADMEQSIRHNIMRLVGPHLKFLEKQLFSDSIMQEHLQIVREHLGAIADSFTKKLENLNLKLTQREILVASLIRDGRSTKEIARLLKISPRSVETYRNNIRKKLNLNKTKINLREYLQEEFE